MAKKLKKTEKSGNQQLAEGVRASAQQIWQAGLDALAKTQQEGSKVISRLAREGSSLQQRTQKIAEGKVSDVSDGLIKLTSNVGKQASGSWDKLEQLIEDTITRSLTNLGLSTQKELLVLHKRIDDAIKSPTGSGAGKPSAKKAPAKKAEKKAAVKSTAPARKAAVKKIAAKPAAKKKTAAKAAAKSV